MLARRARHPLLWDARQRGIFSCEAGEALGRSDVRRTAAERLAAVVQAAGSAGDYRWNSGKRQFNLSLFRGLAGVGYTLLRQVDELFPNVLIWE